MTITVETLRGEAMRPYLDDLATLRMTVFREFPYLYDGSRAYETDYLDTYAQAPGAVLVLARDGERAIGAASALPMTSETDEVQAPFREAGYDLDEIFYFGESVLEAGYRGAGIGKAFMEGRLAAAREAKAKIATFCAVERPEDHPMRPEGYRPLHGFWQAQGFVHHPEMRTTFSWKDIGETGETRKPLSFWIKTL
ncbi:GNAT family N-acetyltransferase [Paracoccaceae bacterium GXU_MW_L88]